MAHGTGPEIGTAAAAAAAAAAEGQPSTELVVSAAAYQTWEPSGVAAMLGQNVEACLMRPAIL